MGRLVEVNASTVLERKLFDGATTKGVRAHVFDETGTEFTGSPFTLTHASRGRYRTTFTPDAEGYWSIEYLIYTDGTFTALDKKYQETGEILSVRSVDQDLATLLGRLTATRAGYLDNLPNLDATISSRQSEANALSRYTNLVAEHDVTQAAVAALPSNSSIADAVWDEARSGHTSVGSFGESNQGVVSVTRATNLDNLDTTVSSRESESSASTRHTENQNDLNTLQVD